MKMVSWDLQINRNGVTFVFMILQKKSTYSFMAAFASETTSVSNYNLPFLDSDTHIGRSRL